MLKKEENGNIQASSCFRIMYKINNFNIDWLSKESHWLFDESQKTARALAEAARKAPFYPAHIGLLTSGRQKAVLISKEAVLTAAKAAVKHLSCERKKLWLVPLPSFHIAGLAVSARAFCGGFSFENHHWEGPFAFAQELKEKSGSYTSLAPAQVYDLVSAKLRPPPSLEFALTGGGALSADLYQKARALGWPLLPTYGMTEAASQVATALRSSLTASPPLSAKTKAAAGAGQGDAAKEKEKEKEKEKAAPLKSGFADRSFPALSARRRAAGPSSFKQNPLTEQGEKEAPVSAEAAAWESQKKSSAERLFPLPQMRVLSHIQIREERGLLSLKSPALLTRWFHLSAGRFENPKDSEGWLQTEDRGRLLKKTPAGESKDKILKAAAAKTGAKEAAKDCAIASAAAAKRGRPSAGARSGGGRKAPAAEIRPKGFGGGGGSGDERSGMSAAAGSGADRAAGKKPTDEIQPKGLGGSRGRMEDGGNEAQISFGSGGSHRRAGDGGKEPIELIIEGRADEQVKISGYLVSLSRLSERLQIIAREIIDLIEESPAPAPTESGPPFKKGEASAAGKSAPIRTSRLSNGGRRPKSRCPKSAGSLTGGPPRIGKELDKSGLGEGGKNKGKAGAPPRGTVCLVALPHRRKEHELALAADFCDVKALAEIVRRFNQDAPRAERVKAVYTVKAIPRKALFKPDTDSLKKLLSGDSSP